VALHRFPPAFGLMPNYAMKLCMARWAGATETVAESHAKPR
jgi:hypothetical protein